MNSDWSPEHTKAPSLESKGLVLVIVDFLYTAAMSAVLSLCNQSPDKALKA